MIERLLADPCLTLWNGMFWLYATNDGKRDWLTHTINAFSSKDLTNWVDNGVAYDSLVEVSWERDRCKTWAPSVWHVDDVQHVLYTAEGGNIACAVAKEPFGPFKDIGSPLIEEDAFDGYQIDPSVFIDDGGESWLLWGNTIPYAAPLSDDGTSVDLAQVRRFDFPNFREALDLKVRNGLYHATWSVNDTRSRDYHVEYAIAPDISGPWTHVGILLEQNPRLGIYGTGHHSILQVPGTDDWIIAYHRWAIQNGSGWRREVVFAPLSFDENGLMRSVVPDLRAFSFTI